MACARSALSAAAACSPYNRGERFEKKQEEKAEKTLQNFKKEVLADGPFRRNTHSLRMVFRKDGTEASSSAFDGDAGTFNGGFYPIPASMSA